MKISDFTVQFSHYFSCIPLDELKYVEPKCYVQTITMNLFISSQAEKSQKLLKRNALSSGRKALNSLMYVWLWGKGEMWKFHIQYRSSNRILEKSNLMKTIQSQWFSGLWLEKAIMCSTENYAVGCYNSRCVLVCKIRIYTAVIMNSQNGGEYAKPMLIHGL